MVGRIRCYDIFCGGGGSSRGAVMAGATVVGGLDAWDLAADTFKLNFANAHVLNKRAAEIDPCEIAKQVGPIDLLLASPECTSHSVAKGKAPRCELSRETAFEVIRFAKALKPRWIVVENVPRMQAWPRFEEWLSGIHDLGFQTCSGVLNAQDFQTAQTRKRLFIVCDRKEEPTLPTRLRGRKRQVGSIIKREAAKGDKWTYRPLHRGLLADATMERAERAIDALGRHTEFIIVYYGTDGAGGYQSVQRPLRTITTLDRFAYVRPTKTGHEMRMLQPQELAAAMGFPAKHRWPQISRRDKIKMIGNAVCPRLMCAVIQHLVGSNSGIASAAAGKQ